MPIDDKILNPLIAAGAAITASVVAFGAQWLNSREQLKREREQREFQAKQDAAKWKREQLYLNMANCVYHAGWISTSCYINRKLVLDDRTLEHISEVQRYLALVLTQWEDKESSAYKSLVTLLPSVYIGTPDDVALSKTIESLIRMLSQDPNVNILRPTLTAGVSEIQSK